MDFLKYINKIESNNSISFLNIEIIRCKDGTILTNWHKKDTYSGRFINFFSNHPIKQKSAKIKNLVDSAILLSHHSFHQKNLSIVRKLLELNNNN